jgi:SAM-dependent methyltransferase
MSSSERSDSVGRNVAAWTKANTEYTDGSAAAAWARDELRWGVFGVPESELRVLGDVGGLDVVELGCGTAFLSASLAKLGATRVVGVDPTPAQLETARRLVAETGIPVELVEAAAESVPLPDASFDLAVSEYGACLWAVPDRWLAEASRLLRPGGRLIFLTGSPLLVLCLPDEGLAGERLLRSQFGPARVEWPGEEGVEYHLSHGDWIRLLRASSFDVEALHELRAPDDAQTHGYYDYVTAEWARRWPAEDLWVARRR